MTGRHLDPESQDAYLLGDLDPDLQAEMTAHVAQCDACRESVGRLAVALAAYRDAEPDAADEVALGRLLAAARFDGRRRPRRRWTSIAMAAAAATIIFMGGFWAGRRDVLQDDTAGASIVPAAAPRTVRHQPDHAPPTVTFAVADSDLLGGLAARDTTWN